jgi:hypothetical protein
MWEALVLQDDQNVIDASKARQFICGFLQKKKNKPLLLFFLSFSWC